MKKCPFGRTPLFLRCEEVKKVWKVVCIKCSRNVFVTIWDLYWQWLVSITSVKPVLKFTRHDKMLSIYFIQSATCICGRHCQTCLWNQSIGEKKMRKQKFRTTISWCCWRCKSTLERLKTKGDYCRRNQRVMLNIDEKWCDAWPPKPTLTLQKEAKKCLLQPSKSPPTPLPGLGRPARARSPANVPQRRGGTLKWRCGVHKAEAREKMSFEHRECYRNLS